jgi:glucose-6-phosphate 1-dehydrogenase
LLQAVEVYFLEHGDASARGAFYDAIGALRDVGQNHMLELFAAVVGGPRAEAIEALEKLSPEEVSARTSRGQYDGYTQGNGVSPTSQTETCFKIETRFGATKVVFEGGKGFNKDRKEVALTYRNGEQHVYRIDENRKRSEYEILILDCMRGDHSRFASMSEVLAAWRFIDPIEAAWQAGNPKLVRYALGATLI